ncbi:MAG: LamG-like jellyroll fold domain-containing protein [Planctomycetota bacterium]
MVVAQNLKGYNGDPDPNLDRTTDFIDKLVFYESGKPIILLGDEENIFDWTYDRCHEYDIPDMPAHAFRDKNGKINLLATHFFNFRSIGDDFDSLERDCAAIMMPVNDPYPENYNDCIWLSSHWIEPGTDIVHALTHHEYQGDDHPDISGCTSGYFECLWGSITYAVSPDGGKTFTYAYPPDHLVLTVPYQYEPNVGTFVGVIGPSNIIKDGDYYYAAFQVVGGLDTNPYKKLVPGWSMMRTGNLYDPRRWKIWDGEDFNIVPINPYNLNSLNTKAHVPGIISYNTIPLGGRSLLYSDYLERYVTTSEKDISYYEGDDLIRLKTFGVSYSDDLINWDLASSFRIKDLTLLAEPYATFIDHDSPSDNFEQIGQYPHLYFSRVYGGQGPYKWVDRDLIRMPVKMIKWEEAAKTLNLAGFEYYGVTLENEPAVGNGLLEVIGVNITGVDFFELIEQGGLTFDRNENRMGIYGHGLLGFIDPKVHVHKSLWCFPDFNDYKNFIENGTIPPGTVNLDAIRPIPINCGFGMVLKNTPPEHDRPVLSKNNGLKCVPCGMVDYDNDEIFPIMAFKKNIGYFAQAIFPFENSQANLPITVVKNYGAGADINEYLPQALFGGDMLEHVEGVIGGAYCFDGYSFFHLQDSRGFELNSNESMTIEFFVQFYDYHGRTLLSNNDRFDDHGSMDQSYYYGIIAKDGVIYFFMNPDGDVNNTEVVDTLWSDASGAMDLFTFYHVAIVMDAEEGRIISYVDGEARKAVDYDPSVPVIPHKMENRLWIGGTNNKFLNYAAPRFKGVLDEIRIYKHALPAEMIKAHKDGDYSIISSKFLGGEWSCEVTPSDGKLIGKTKQSRAISTGEFKKEAN